MERMEKSMLSRRQLIDYGLSLPGAYEEHPFGDGTLALRYQGNKKIFALFLSYQGQELLNLKCDPLLADIMRQQFQGVQPGYHMNKTHWISVVLGSDVPREDMLRLMEHSFDLIRGKPKAKRPPAAT